MDGTLFWGDSQLRFARWIVKRHPWRRAYLLLLLPCAILRGLGIWGTPQMKRAFLAYAWGMKQEELQEECKQFCQEELLPALFPEVKARLEQHQKEGHTTVLCSASPDWWTQELGRALHFDLVIGTPIESCDTIPWMPTIPPPGNNKGSNKLLRLAEHKITQADICYTDSAADLPMCSISKKSVLVNPHPALIQKLGQAELIKTPAPCSKISFILGCLLGC